MTRAERIVEELGADVPVAAQGMLLIPHAIAAVSSGDAATAFAIADQIVSIATAVDEPDLLAFGRLTAGQAALVAGDIARSMRLFDEVMVSVTMGDVSPIPAGIIYCAVVDGCVEACDLRRAAEWTEALRRWCDDQPDLVPYRGQCMVHRSQVLLAHGSWADAAVEAERASARDWRTPSTPRWASRTTSGARCTASAVSSMSPPTPIARRVGTGTNPSPASRCCDWRRATSMPQCGPLGGCSTSTAPGWHGSRLLAAAVEVRLAAGDTAGARELADELASLAAAMGTEMLEASALFANGTVLLASGNEPSAITALRAACKAWRDVQVPYEVARSRYQLGLAYRAAGDGDAAGLELDGARAAFESLGAAADLARMESPTTAKSGVLTERECQVLRLVAAGKTNREIAAELVISEHTVSRHLQNMFMKLGVTSRAAATAYAYEHQLV